MEWLSIDPQFLDYGNSFFEVSGGFFVATSCYEMHKKKLVSGVTIPYITFFVVWGFWNIPYYFNLDQPWSLYGAFGVCLTNCIWMAQIIYYKRFYGRNNGNKECRLCGAVP